MARRASRPRRLPGVQAHDRRLRRARGRSVGTARLWLSRVARALKVLVLAGAIAVGSWHAHEVATTSTWFTVEDVRVSGLERLSHGEVEALLSGLTGRNALVTPLEPWRARLLSSPWVKEATIRRALPGAVDVIIVERRPVALARMGRELLLVDEEGTVIDEYGPRYAALDLPLVDGLTDRGADHAAPDAARMAVAAAVLRDLAGAGLLWRVSQIDVGTPRDAVLLLNDDPALLHLGAERFAERLQAYLDMSRRLQSMVAGLDYVDLRFDDRVYVRPRKAGSTFTAAPSLSAPGPALDVADEPDAAVLQE